MEILLVIIMGIFVYLCASFMEFVENYNPTDSPEQIQKQTELELLKNQALQEELEFKKTVFRLKQVIEELKFKKEFEEL